MEEELSEAERERLKRQYRGVFWDKKTRRWRCQLGYQSKKIFLGYFDTAQEAAKAYDRKLVELRGPSARTNFPITEYMQLLGGAGGGSGGGSPQRSAFHGALDGFDGGGGGTGGGGMFDHLSVMDLVGGAGGGTLGQHGPSQLQLTQQLLSLTGSGSGGGGVGSGDLQLQHQLLRRLDDVAAGLGGGAGAGNREVTSGYGATSAPMSLCGGGLTTSAITAATEAAMSRLHSSSGGGAASGSAGGSLGGGSLLGGCGGAGGASLFGGLDFPGAAGPGGTASTMTQLMNELAGEQHRRLQLQRASQDHGADAGAGHPGSHDHEGGSGDGAGPQLSGAKRERGASSGDGSGFGGASAPMMALAGMGHQALEPFAPASAPMASGGAYVGLLDPYHAAAPQMAGGGGDPGAASAGFAASGLALDGHMGHMGAYSSGLPQDVYGSLGGEAAMPTHLMMMGPSSLGMDAASGPPPSLPPLARGGSGSHGGAVGGSGLRTKAPRGSSNDGGEAHTFRGVFWDKKSRRWRCQLGHKNKKIFLGYFNDAAEAARAYDAKLVELNGANAKTNFPLHDYLVPTGNSTRGTSSSNEAVTLQQRPVPLRSSLGGRGNSYGDAGPGRLDPWDAGEPVDQLLPSDPKRRRLEDGAPGAPPHSADDAAAALLGRSAIVAALSGSGNSGGLSAGGVGGGVGGPSSLSSLGLGGSGLEAALENALLGRTSSSGWRVVETGLQGGAAGGLLGPGSQHGTVRWPGGSAGGLGPSASSGLSLGGPLNGAGGAPLGRPPLAPGGGAPSGYPGQAGTTAGAGGLYLDRMASSEVRAVQALSGLLGEAMAPGAIGAGDVSWLQQQRPGHPQQQLPPRPPLSLNLGLGQPGTGGAPPAPSPSPAGTGGLSRLGSSEVRAVQALSGLQAGGTGEHPHGLTSGSSLLGSYGGSGGLLGSMWGGSGMAAGGHMGGSSGGYGSAGLLGSLGGGLTGGLTGSGLPMSTGGALPPLALGGGGHSSLGGQQQLPPVAPLSTNSMDSATEAALLARVLGLGGGGGGPGGGAGLGGGYGGAGQGGGAGVLGNSFFDFDAAGGAPPSRPGGGGAGGGADAAGVSTDDVQSVLQSLFGDDIVRELAAAPAASGAPAAGGIGQQLAAVVAAAALRPEAAAPAGVAAAGAPAGAAAPLQVAAEAAA